MYLCIPCGYEPFPAIVWAKSPSGWLPARSRQARPHLIFENLQVLHFNDSELTTTESPPAATMATAASKHVQLALALPARLRTFLARYPHPSILPAGANPETYKTAYQEETPNPFLPTKHPVTGRWHEPKYSLRRQAELVKMAREHGVEELLPYTPKGTETRLRKRVELGLRVKGTGVGQTVKGHKYERELTAKYDWTSIDRQLWFVLLTCYDRMEKRRQAMLEMPALIREWKKVCREKLPVRPLLYLFLSNYFIGWETELDQVPEINGHMPCTRTAMCLDCTITNVQHSRPWDSNDMNLFVRDTHIVCRLLLLILA